eukprot:Gb_05499 [translate_table: standard]
MDMDTDPPPLLVCKLPTLSTDMSEASPSLW